MSASEVAFFSISRSEVKKLKKEDTKDASIAKLMQNPSKLLATILTANNLVNVSIVIASTYATHHIIDFGGNLLLEFVFQTIIITFLLLLFGEILPKIYATLLGIRFARAVSGIMTVTEKILTPITWILTRSTNALGKWLNKNKRKGISVDELSSALRLTNESEGKGTKENAILESIVHFSSIYVSEVMTPRTEMTSLSVAARFKQVLELIKQCGYSRIPVYNGTEDNIRGILYVKDLLPHLDKGDNFRWQTLVRNAYFVPETKKIDDLLTDFQKNKIHIAIVVDEFGGTSGVVTMKDVLEEIMGNIADEYDDEQQPLYRKTNDGRFVFEAKIPLNDFFKIENIQESDFENISDEVETLAGLLLEIKGEIPSPGQEIDFKQYHFTILKADNRHIQSVKLSIGNKKS
ncbi:MAG: gliding motility-associated protein GldE [Paludibacteraceae bacterium]|nr:gliding motility-associated protein GldE [Paludibacteraceae bacterium]